MERSNSPDALSTLRRRIELLDLLIDDARDKRSLVETLPVSRSTVSRGISELTDQGFVERTDGEFRATTAGRIAARHYHEATATLSGLTDVGDALSRLPEGCLPPPSLFRDDRVVTDDEGDPLRYLLRRITAADSVVAVRGPLRPELPSAIRDGVVDGSFSMRLTLTEAAADLLDSYHRTDLDAMLGTEGFELSTLDADLPFGVYLAERGADRAAYLAIHGEDHRVRSVVRTESDGGLVWADRRFEGFRERATPYDRS